MCSIFIQKGFYKWNWKQLRELNSNKATTFGDIPTKIWKQNSKSCSDTLHKLFNVASQIN